jgi:hypothetical protein
VLPEEMQKGKSSQKSYEQGRELRKCSNTKANNACVGADVEALPSKLFFSIGKTSRERNLDYLRGPIWNNDCINNRV